MGEMVKSKINNMGLNKNFWKNKKVFITGNTGFKGSWITLWLLKLGAQIKGYSISLPSNPSLFEILKIDESIEHQFGDICDLSSLESSMKKFDPDIVIHMAAQPLVRRSYTKPLETFNSNIIGTANVLEVARKCSNVKSILCVTTDKCYDNKEWNWSYREIDSLGGRDPYSSSKACAEIITEAYRKSFYDHLGISIASVRAGNVIGGGDWSTDRLIPDILDSFENKTPIIIRNPHAIRPWQHVLEPLYGYLLLCELMFDDTSKKYSRGWNFGPNESGFKSVQWILETMIQRWGEKVSWKLDQKDNPHESKTLKLDISDAKYHLDWYPKWDIDTTIKSIVEWHRGFLLQKNMIEICENEINEYENNGRQ